MSARVYVDDRVVLDRDALGLFHIRADRDQDLYRGLGLAHGIDRGLQMIVMRILGQGRAAACLDPGLLAADRFFRRMNWRAVDRAEVDALSASVRPLVDAYVDGVNRAFDRSLPWERKLLRLPVEPWTVQDCIMMARMTGYLTLAQSQGEIERLLLQMVRAGVDAARLENLFPGKLEGLDVELIKQLRHVEMLVPDQVKWSCPVPRMMASNNWVVAGSRSASGAPLLANDPHLEINRLPAVWYEVVLQTPDRFGFSGTMPGLPGLLLGRTNDLAWGATYTFADCIDSWIEEVKGGQVRREDGFIDLHRRVETIEVKGGPAVEAVYWDSPGHGTLDGTPDEDGMYLATRWSGDQSGFTSIEAIAEMWRADSVRAGMAALGRIEASFNWVLADRGGHIGYQMSGLVPIRRPGWLGLVPGRGWAAEDDWQGFVSLEDLPRAYDPEEGYLVTANDDLNHLGKSNPINMSMGRYRAERIAELIEATPTHTVVSMQRIQMDIRSNQAARFMAVLAPLLPSGESADALRGWNCTYGADSLGAHAFERFYQALIREVFGAGVGAEVVSFLAEETGLFTDFYAAFDEVLLAEDSPWFAGRARDEIFRAVAAEALTEKPEPWERSQRFICRHLLFGAKLPRLFGFDRGPFTLIGGRATPHQGQLYRSGDRETSFAPSLRLITDMAEEAWHSVLAGGPSDRRFSRWYASELKDWLAGRLKRVRPITDSQKAE